MKVTVLPLIFVSLFFFGASCAKKPKQGISPVAITTFKVTPQTIPATNEFMGVARSSHPVEIRARVEGYLLEIAYTEGSQVSKGDVLFRIDPREFEARLDQAQGGLSEKQALLWNAKRTVERLKPLYEQNAVSRRDLDLALSQELQAAAQVAAAQAKVDSAELDLSYTTVTSPITGLAGSAKTRAGTLITPSVNGLLTTVSIVNPIWIYFSISDNDLLKQQAELEKKRLLLPNADHFEVRLILADGTMFPFTGKVKFTSPTLDPTTGSLMVRASFPNPQNELKPGQFVRAIVSGAVRPNAIFVPQKAILQGANEMFVYVVKDGKAEHRTVVPGDWYNDYWIINSGLAPGEEVVLDGVNKIQGGWPVNVLKTVVPPPPPKEQESVSLTCEA